MRLVLGLLQFFPTATIVNDAIDHAIFIFQGYLGGAQRVFRFHGDGHDLSVDAGEQIRPFELHCVLTAGIWGARMRTPPSQGLTLNPNYLYMRVKNPNMQESPSNQVTTVLLHLVKKGSLTTCKTTDRAGALGNSGNKSARK